MATTKIIPNVLELNPGDPENVLKATNAVTVSNASGSNKYYFDGVYDGKFGLRIGTTVLTGVPSAHPIAIINNGKTSQISYTGTTSAGTGTGPDGNTYTFYYGDITITVSADFGTVSYYCLYHGYMGGQDNLVSVYSDAGLKMPKGTAFPGGETAFQGMMRNDTSQSSESSSSTMQHYNGISWKNFVNKALCTTATCNYPTTATALYQFEDNINDTCGSHDLSSFSNGAYGTGNFGKAADFNGSNAYILSDAGSPEIFENSSGGVLSFWINPDNLTGNQDLVAAHNGSWSANFGWIVRLDSSGIKMYVYNSGAGDAYGGNGPLQSTVTVSSSTWTQIAIRWNGNVAGKTSEVFINGQNKTTGGTLAFSSAPNINNTQKITIGDSMNGNWYEGLIDQLRVFPSYLSDAQMLELYNEVGC